MKLIFKFLIITTMTALSVNGQVVPSKWAQYTVVDTVNIPIDIYWQLSFKLNLEEIGSVGKYKDLPKIVKTTPVTGDFSKIGDSRRVYFSNDKTLLESIIIFENPENFAYELTEIEIDLKRVAKRARGHFRYYSLSEEQTKIVWTYGFDHKNILFKWLINKYIKKTHQFWMEDTLAEMKRQTEKMYQEMKNEK